MFLINQLQESFNLVQRFQILTHQMRKIIQSIFRLKDLAFKQPANYHKTNAFSRSFFSTFKSDRNPNEMQQEVKRMMRDNQQKQRKSQQLPILKQISQMKGPQELPSIYKKLSFISKQNRQIAVRYLLSAIYSNKLPYQSIEQRSLQVTLAQFPHLTLQTQIFRINHQIQKAQNINQSLTNQNASSLDKEQKQKDSLLLYNKINDLYFHSFNTTLKNISSENLARSKATLYKHFAEYNFQYLFNPNINDKNSSLFDASISTLKKARQFLNESLKHHKQIILNEYKKLQSEDNNKLKQQDGQRHQIKLSAIKQNIRKIAQSMGECLYALFKVINKQNRILKDPSQHKNRKIQLCSLIELYIPLYSVIPGIKQLSLMYYKLYKIKIEAKFTSVSEPKTPEQAKAKIKETVQQYLRLHKQCQDCLDESIKNDNFSNIKQISTTMISIKYMMGRNVRKNQTQIKNNLALEAKTILDKVKDQFKQPMQYYLLHFIKQLLQVKS